MVSQAAASPETAAEGRGCNDNTYIRIIMQLSETKYSNTLLPCSGISRLRRVGMFKLVNDRVLGMASVDLVFLHIFTGGGKACDSGNMISRNFENLANIAESFSA